MNMEWWWNRGVERSKTEGNAERFWIYIFSIRNEVRIWNLHLQDWEDSANIWQMCAIHTVMSTDSTVLLLLTNKAEKSTQWGESSLQKSSALSWHKIWRSLLTNWICCIAAKTTTSLWNENEKMIIKWCIFYLDIKSVWKNAWKCYFKGRRGTL